MEDMPLPPHFPHLPALPDVIWSANVRQAHTVMSQSYNSASTVLRQEDSDPLRLRFHLNRLLDETFPILVALEGHQEDPIPPAWLTSAAEALSSIIAHVHNALSNSTDQYVQKTQILHFTLTQFSKGTTGMCKKLSQCVS